MKDTKIVLKIWQIILITAVPLIIMTIAVLFALSLHNKAANPIEPTETLETTEPSGSVADTDKDFEKVYRYYFGSAPKDEYPGLLYDYYEENDISFGMIQLDYLVRTNIMEISSETAYALGDEMSGDLGRLFTGISVLKKGDVYAGAILIDARSDEEHLEEELQFLEMSGYSYVGTIDDDGNMTDSFVESTLEKVDREYADPSQLKLYDNNNSPIHCMEIDGLSFYVYTFTVIEKDYEFTIYADYMGETTTLMTYDDLVSFLKGDINMKD